MSNSYAHLIEVNPEIRGGKPVIKGTRIAVVDILDYLAGGETVETILEQWDYLSREQIQAALAYAADIQRRLTSATYAAG